MEVTEDMFDFLIIGGGKAGKTLAMKQALLGKKVAMVERGMIGGSCINVACIPTKTMVKSAKVEKLIQHASKYGVQVTNHQVEMKGVVARRNEVVNEMVSRNQKAFDSSGMKLYIGNAQFIGDRTVEVVTSGGGGPSSKLVLKGATVIINTGTRPNPPPIKDIPDLVKVKTLLDSTSIQQLETIPSHLVVLGTGYIGCEFAQIFRRFGSKVTMIDKHDVFLPREEPEISKECLNLFHDEGIEVLLQSSIAGITEKRVSGNASSPLYDLQIRQKDGSNKMNNAVVENVSHVLVALGRIPNTENLSCERTGVQLDGRGFVKVNEKLQTANKNIFAVGDCNGGPQFTHVSFDDLRIVTSNLNGGDRTTTNRLIPYTLFIDPELGRVGMTEAEAKSKNFNVKTAILPVSAIPRAVTLGEVRGLLKAVVDVDTDRILGFSALAPEGGEIATTVQIAMQNNAKFTSLRDTIFSHPSMSESLNDLFAKF